MAKTKVEDIRNMRFGGTRFGGQDHAGRQDAVHTGTVNAQPSVDRRHEHLRLRPRGESAQVHDRGERRRISLTRGKHFHVIDTPGYPDFIGQTIGAMRASTRRRS